MKWEQKLDGCGGRRRIKDNKNCERLNKHIRRGKVEKLSKSFLHFEGLCENGR